MQKCLIFVTYTKIASCIIGGHCGVLWLTIGGAIVSWQFVSHYPEMVGKFVPMNFPHSPAIY